MIVLGAQPFTCITPVVFETMASLSLKELGGDKGTQVPVTAPSGAQPLLDYWGLPSADAATLKLDRVPLVGATAGETFNVTLRRATLDDDANLTLAVQGHPLTFLDATGKTALAKNRVPNGKTVTLNIKPDALKTTGAAAVKGEISRIDVMRDGVSISSLAVRSFALMTVRVRLATVLLVNKDNVSGGTPSFPSVSAAMAVVNEIWKTGGVHFGWKLEPEAFSIQPKLSNAAIDLADGSTDDMKAIIANNVENQVNIYLVKRHVAKDSKGEEWDGTYGVTNPASKWVYKAAKPNIVAFAENVDGKDAWADVGGSNGFGFMLAHEIGHYFDLRHRLPPGDRSGDGFMAQMGIMYNWLPCGHLLPAYTDVTIPKSGRNEGSVKARQSIVDNKYLVKA